MYNSRPTTVKYKSANTEIKVIGGTLRTNKMMRLINEKECAEAKMMSFCYQLNKVSQSAEKNSIRKEERRAKRFLR